MQKNIHPTLNKLEIHCRCGKHFEVFSTMSQTPQTTERCGSCLTMGTDAYKSKQDTGSARERLFENFNISDVAG